jgi:hypothetical protein
MNIDYSIDGRRRAGKFYSATGESMANPKPHNLGPKFAEIFAARAKLEHDTGGREMSGNFLSDDRRLVQEFGVRCAPIRRRVLQIINDIRK